MDRDIINRHQVLTRITLTITAIHLACLRAKCPHTHFHSIYHSYFTHFIKYSHISSFTSHTPQVCTPLHSLILTSLPSNPQSAFCLRQNDGSAAPVILFLVSSIPLCLPQGAQINGVGGVWFWSAGHFKILSFFKVSRVDFSHCFCSNCFYRDGRSLSVLY